MSGPAPRLRAVVAVLTYRRPDDLAALLPQLVEQRGRVADQVDVLVVDNDPAAGARGWVTAFGQDVIYRHAATPGIAAARNAALDAAADADLLVFIDDDERPVRDWLSLLLETWRKERSAAVVGPVISEYVQEPEPWVRAGAFFTRRRLPTGTTVDVAATNNLLLDLRWVNERGLRFDSRFGLSGGSDTLFTRQIHAFGGRMVWCDEAVVVDIVPPERVTRDWVLRRAYRSGNGWIMTSLEMQTTLLGRARTRIALAARGAMRLGGGMARIVFGHLTRDVGHQARGWRTSARGAGLLMGAAGRHYFEYKRAA